MDWESAERKEDGDWTIPARWLDLHYYESLNILFRMENALRVFVYVILKNAFKDKWVETNIQIGEEESSTIGAIARKRITQAKGFGYLGYEITSPLMYLNSGELTRLITSEAYWELFQPYFKGKKEIIKTKLEEVGTVRNSLAHFRPLKYDDVELIKQNVKHAFVGIEECLGELIGTINVVPTNTDANWYKSLSTLGTDLCGVRLFQSKREEWIRVQLTYNVRVLAKNKTFAGSLYFRVLNLITPAIVRKFPRIAVFCTYLMEEYAGGSVKQGTDGIEERFVKRASLVFGRRVLEEHRDEIFPQLQEMLLQIEKESELVTKDHLARGELVEAVQVVAQYHEKASYWSVKSTPLRCPFSEQDPTEYWGDVGLYQSDFIASTTKFPWMPSEISSEDLPF